MPGVLLVGFGRRGREWAKHCRAAGAKIAGVVDPEPGARAQSAWPAWPTLQEALAGVSAEAAIVASTPAEHPGDAAACLGAGLPTLVEKPLALSLAAAAETVRAAEEAGKPLLVAQTFRFLPRERSIARAAGELGEPVRTLVQSARPVRAIPTHLASIEFGPLWDLAVHHLDVLRLRAGSAPERVAAEVEGSLYRLALRWPNGYSAHYQHCEGAPVSYHHEWIEGKDAALSVDRMEVRLRRPGRRPRRIRPGRSPKPERILLAELFSGNGTSSLSGADNLLTVAVVEAAVHSLRLERPVELGALLQEIRS